MVEHGDAVGERHDDPHVVLDDQHCRRLGDLAHQRDEAVDLAVGQALGRLVEDQQPGLQREAHGDLQQPLVAIGEGAGGVALAAVKADPVEHRVGEPLAPRGRRAGSRAASATLSIDREVREDAGDLERVGDAEPHPLECAAAG